MGLMTAGGGLGTGKLALANAATGDVLTGKKFYAGDKTLKTGTMANQGTKNVTIAPGGSYTIPKGFHSGSGKVKASKAKTELYYQWKPNAAGKLNLDVSISSACTAAVIEITSYEPDKISNPTATSGTISGPYNIDRGLNGENPFIIGKTYLLNNITTPCTLRLRSSGASESWGVKVYRVY